MNLQMTTVKRYLKQLEEINLGGLSPEIIAEKRREVDAELSEAIREARALYYHYKNGIPKYVKGKPVEDKDGNVLLFDCGNMTRQFHERWTNCLAQKSKLYGLETVRPEVMNANFSQTNIGEQHNYSKKEKEETNKEIFADYESTFRNGKD
jgi:hypothetical protein